MVQLLQGGIEGLSSRNARGRMWKAQNCYLRHMMISDVECCFCQNVKRSVREKSCTTWNWCRINGRTHGSKIMQSQNSKVHRVTFYGHASDDFAGALCATLTTPASDAAPEREAWMTRTRCFAGIRKVRVSGTIGRMAFFCSFLV